jgi:hypothetical protein
VCFTARRHGREWYPHPSALSPTRARSVINSGARGASDASGRVDGMSPLDGFMGRGVRSPC